jgi:gas vesicle protein
MRENGNDLVFFVLGGLAGASIALLLAPRAGRETRQMVAARIRDGERYARQGIQRGRQVVARTVSTTRDLAERTLETGRDIAEKGAEMARKATESHPAPAPVEKLT